MEGKIDASDFYQLEKDHFHVLERNTLVPNDLDTGDILLFSRRCSDMNLIGAVLCYVAQQYSPWDHVCVIVKDPSTNKLYAFEAALSGCQLYELDDRINHSKAPAIAVRYLRMTRTDQQRKAIWKLVNEMNGKPYMSDPNILFKAGVWSPQKFKRLILQNKESFLKQQIAELNETHTTTAVDPMTSIFINIASLSLQKELCDMQEVIQKERKSRLEGEEVDNEFFCSHSVAHILKAMNVLPSSIPSTEYLPFSFSSEVELPLLRGASFSKELFLRGQKSTVFGETSVTEATNYFIELVQNALLKTEEKEETSEDSENTENTEKVEKPEEDYVTAPHEDVLSLLSTDDLNYILTQLRLTRSLGRTSVGSLKQFLQSMKISYYLPGDTLQLSNPNMVLSLLLRGGVTFNKWSDTLGESVTENRSRYSLLGYAAYPMDASQLVRITADDIAALGCASGGLIESVAREAPGIHRMERVQLIKAMKNHSAFQHLSFQDLYRLSYYYYKVNLDVGDTVSREGSFQSYVYFVNKGTIERKEEEKAVLMEQGTFPGLDALMNNLPSPATYTVKTSTTVFVLDPAVLTYFTGGRFMRMRELLEQLRNPVDLALGKILWDAVDSISFLDAEESVTSMSTVFSAVKNNSGLVLTEEAEKEINLFTDLLGVVYEKKKPTAEESTEGNEGQTVEESFLSLFSTVYSSIVGLFVEQEEHEQKVGELDKDLARYRKYNRLQEYSDEEIISILHSFQFKTVDEIATYLLYLLFTGTPEPCTVTRSMFIERGNATHILTPSNQQQILQFFFGDQESLSYTEFTTKLQSTDLPEVIQQKNTTIKQLINNLVPNLNELSKQQDLIIQSHRQQDTITLSCHSPFDLLPYPLPLPYVMTFALEKENPSLDYRKYILGGLFGELFGRFMLYPAYLSSFTRILSRDITPLNMFSLIFGEKAKQFFSIQPVISPPPSEEKPMKKTLANQKSTVIQKPSKPIVISDSHIEEVKQGKAPRPEMEIKPVKPQVKGVNPIVGGISRYCCGFFLERAIQITCFPMILRSVKDAKITADLSRPVQCMITGALLGCSISVVKHPLDRKYFQRVLNLPKASHLSIWKRAYAGFLPSCLHYSVFNAVFFGTFGLFWDLNNRDYVRDHGFSHYVSHQRESVFEDVQPVHYDLLGRSIICLTCGYTLAQLICYPFGVYRNMKMAQSFNANSLSPLYSQVNSLKAFFSKPNRAVLYGGVWTRICWSVLSCSMGIAFGSALLTKNFRDKHN